MIMHHPHTGAVTTPLRVAVVGASGYAGAELIRLLAAHPHVEIAGLFARDRDGAPLGDAYPHLAPLGLRFRDGAPGPGEVDVAFLALPHGESAELAVRLASGGTTVVDVGSDLRLADPSLYSTWYGFEHPRPEALAEAVYGLTEHARDRLPRARLIANPGCYPTATLLALRPFACAGVLTGDVVVDAKSGVSGAGRSPKQNTLFCEVGEGLSPSSIAKHRHAPEIEQEVGRAAGAPARVNFTPHLIPMSRGELCTCYVRLARNGSARDLRAALEEAYAREPFVRVAPAGIVPQTQNVRGSNYVQIGVFEDRIPGRAILVSVLDNLVKGSAGQALQNMNLAFGLEETAGLLQLPMFP